MYRTLGRVPVLSGIVLVLALLGCGPGEEEQARAERATEWASLQETHAELQKKRAELREMKATLAAGPEAYEPAEEGLSPEEALLRIEESAKALEEEIAAAADAFQGRLVNFLNQDPMVQGEEPTETQRAALRMKSTEDTELAREYIDKGGDYRRAIDILERALALDSDNHTLKAELELARDMRFITEERFALVKKGMSQHEVREVIGPVFHRNIKEYENPKALAWFYPKEGGGAAAVFFRESRRTGVWEVYQLDYEAVQIEVLES